MTTPTPPANGSEPMTLAEIRALLEQTTKAATENTRAIIEMRAANAERDDRHDARHDREMAEFHAAMQAMRAANAERDDRRDQELAAINASIAKMSASVDKLIESQERNNQDIGNLKGWGLEIYCARNPEIFADALGLDEEEVIPRSEIHQIAGAAMRAGIIANDQVRNLVRADIFIYARQVSENQPFCLVIETSYQVQFGDVERAADRAAILDTVLQQYRPRHLNAKPIAVVAGTNIAKHMRQYAEKQGVAYVPVPNGQRLTNPPE